MEYEKDILKAIYGFYFPDDFWIFMDFYRELKENSMLASLESMEGLGLIPTGPFQVLWEQLYEKKWELPLLHHMRFYKDPPEFFTIFLGLDDGLHFGYWVDDTKKCDICIAGYYNMDAYGIDFYGTNIMEFLRFQLEEKVVAYQEMELEQKDISYIKQMQKELSMLRNVLVKYGTKERKARGEEYCCLYPQESRSVKAPTWEGMGICVPENTYRLSEEYLFEKNSVPFQYGKCLEEYHTNKMHQWAIHCMEQGLYGNALQIGKNLWCYNEYETEAFDLLEKAYLGLGREDYAMITSQHKLYRKRKSADITCFHEADIKG